MTTHETPERPTLRKKVTPEDIIEGLDRATIASNRAARAARDRTHALWVAVVAVVITGVVLFVQQDGTNDKVESNQNRQDCVLDYLEAHVQRQQGFFIAEWNKVNGQYEGLKRLREASARGDRPGVRDGVTIFLAATKEYRDGPAVTKRLQQLGVKVLTRADGTKYLQVPDTEVRAPC